jgi:hypothetical protein
MKACAARRINRSFFREITRSGGGIMFPFAATRSAGRIAALSVACAVVLAAAAMPAQARVASSQTVVGTSDTLTTGVSSYDGCVYSNLFLSVGSSVSPIGGQPPLAGGTIFYTSYNECTGQYLAGINRFFTVESGGLSLNGDLKYGTARFTTSAIEQVTQSVVPISIDLTFTATGDMQHNHVQLFTYDIFDDHVSASVEQASEWSRVGHVAGRFSVGDTGGPVDADDQYAGVGRGKSTIVTQTFGPPFPQ